MQNQNKLNKTVLAALGLLLIPLLSEASAASNPNLYVSAENPLYDNHFAGSMVIEVVVSDPNLSDTDEGKGEPDVTLNGNALRMVQAGDGKWYAYFANVDRAKIADQISLDAGVPGEGLDFGVFCGRDTISLGPSFSETDGIAIPRETMAGSTDGNTGFTTCNGVPSGSIINNVVRNPRSINTNSAVPTGQIGLDEDAWPIIQLYSFSSNVVIQYNAAGGTQQVTLQYDDIPNISLSLDRADYPPNSEVFATIHDMQLNQDPTARDSWTFNVASPQATFYAAFTENGANAANGNTGLTNLVSKLSSLGFDKNGKISMSLGSVADLKENGFQSDEATDGGPNTYTQIVTFVESQPNTGIFENFDFSNESNIGVLSTAPRGQAATIEYNSKSTSIVSGLGTASINLGTTQALSGQKIPVTVTDSDQNISSGARDRLEVFRSSAIIPSLTIGSPITLEDADSIKIANSTDPLAGGTSVSSSVPDTNSDRLVLDTRPSSGISNQIFERIVLDLGVTATDLKSLLIDVSAANNFGTNWINYDFRSLEKQLGITDFSDTRISLFFGLTDTSPVTLLSTGRLTGAQGFIQNNTAATQISSKSGQAFLVINFDATNNSIPQGTISTETDTQPIVFDLFSFGTKSTVDVNNAIYRFELQETSTNSGIFSGTLEYLIANQLNQYDANTIATLRTIDEDVKFFVNQRLIDEKGINIAYSDVSQVGVTEGSSSKTDINTHSGTVSLTAQAFRFGQPVTVVLYDPDLNVKHDGIDIYSVIDDPASENVDTVGTTGGGILLEVLIKDIRYKRCTVNNVEYGGLGASGFSLVETGPNTGRFQGVFKLPSQICNEGGTKLISSAGGTINLKYHDFRDSSGQSNIFSLSKDATSTSSPPAPSTAKPELETPAIPSWIKSNAKWWSSGVISDSEFIDSIEFLAKEKIIVVKKSQSLEQSKSVPDWIKKTASWWADGLISDEDFAKGLEYLVNIGAIRI
jgi:hypothetical protein